MEKIKSIIVCGMGGSALPGYALDTWSLVEKLPLRVTIWNSYGLPLATEKSAAVFCVSHSGNTEETLSAFHTARKRGHNIFVVTTGGKLEALALQNFAKQNLGGRARKSRITVLKIPGGTPPRMAIAPMTLAILKTLGALKIAKVSRASERALENFNPLAIKKPDTLERDLAKSVPLVYTPREWCAIGHIWKIALNETAKIPAFSYTFPEANHNEMEGFAESPSAINRNFHALFLDFEKSHPRIRRRMALSQKIWARSGMAATRLAVPRDEFWKTFFNILQKGYALSRTIAAIRKVDPNSTNTIEKFKKLIAQ
jgi:glucose/mannose-6-phosphate isomerase